MKDINVAVIGWGFMGRAHTHSLRCIPLMYKELDFRPVLKCLCSGHIENARTGAEAMGFESCTDDWRTLLCRDDIDVVSVCTPNELHEEMVTGLLKAGKHLYIDKPLTTSYESALRIQAAARKSNSKVQMVMNNRFLPATMCAKQIVREGGIGRVLTFGCRYLHSGSIDPDKPIGWKQELQGGVILDLASHALDLVTDMIGFPKEVFCATNRLYEARPTKAGGSTRALSEDHALITMRMADGCMGFCEASKISTGANDVLSFEICGDKGALSFDLTEPGWLYYYDNTLPEAPLGGKKGFTRIECLARYPYPASGFLPPKNAIGWDRGHIHCYYSFLDCVAHDKTPECGIDEAVMLQALMDAAKRSAESRVWEALPE